MLNKVIYQIIKIFLETERFCLSIQLRRASVSISSKFAEVSGRAALKDQSYFYRIVYGSLIEVLSKLYLSVDVELLTENK